MARVAQADQRQPADASAQALRDGGPGQPSFTWNGPLRRDSPAPAAAAE